MAVTMHRVRAIWTGSTGSPYLSTFYLNAPGTTTADSQTALNKVNAFMGALLGGTALGVSFATQPTVDLIQDTNGALVGFNTVTPSSGTGSATGDKLPLANQSFIRWTTGVTLYNRRIQGRYYIPCPTESISDGSPGPVGAWITSVPAAVSTFLSGTTTPVVWVRPKTTGPHAGAPGQAVFISGGTLAAKWAVLRSRRD